MYAKIMEINKEIAEEMLTHNTSNYRKMTSKVKQYTRKMSLGLWQENGEAIQFAKDGTLLNGQHRLQAIIDSNTTQTMVVVYDVEADVFDCGKNRSWQEYSGISTSIGGAITGLLTFSRSVHRTFIGFEEKRNYYLEHSSDLDKAGIYSQRGTAHGIMKKSGCIAAIYCAMRLNILPDSALEAFCVITNSGFPNEQYASESALVLRRALQEGKPTKGTPMFAYFFDITWQALIAFNRGLKSKRKFKEIGCVQEVINKVALLDKEDVA